MRRSLTQAGIISALSFAILPSCQTLGFGEEKAEVTGIAKSVGAEHTTNINIEKFQDPEFLGRLRIRFSCGKTKFSNEYLKSSNKIKSTTVFTSHFNRTLGSSVVVEGLTPSSYSFRQEYFFDRHVVTEGDTIDLKPGDFVQWQSMTVDESSLSQPLDDHVLDVRVEFVLANETHRAWLGYLSPEKDIHTMIPRPDFRKEHGFFRVLVHRVNVISNKMKTYRVTYKKVPREIVVDDTWFALAAKQKEALRPRKIGKELPKIKKEVLKTKKEVSKTKKEVSKTKEELPKIKKDIIPKGG